MFHQEARAAPPDMATAAETTPRSGRICGMRKIFWIFVVALLVIAIALGVGLGVGLTQDDNDGESSSDSINTTLAKIADSNNFPALGAGYDNGTLHAAVVGVRKVGASPNATVNDIWHFGSNTKAMTATTVGILIQGGLFAWTSTLGDLLSSTGITIRDVYSNVTVQQLSTHTSGISDRPLRNSTATLLASYELSAAEGRVLVSNFTLSASPVSIQRTYEYANMNYVLLGLIVDTIAGELVEDVIRSRLWEPLEISTGGFGPNPETSLNSIDNPWPHIGSRSGGRDGLPTPLPEGTPMVQRDNPPCYYTAGAAHMSLQDYAKWCRLHFDASVQARLNLSASLMSKLHEVAPGTGPESYTYGGWGRFNSPSGTGYSLSHDGSNTLNYATALIDVGGRRAAFAVINVGGEPLSGTTWVEGTHLVRDKLMSGEIEF